MSLLLLKLVSITILCVSGIVGVIRDIYKSPAGRRFGYILLIFILISGAVAFITQIVEHLVGTEAELEREADLKYLQMLNTPVVRLGFDLVLETNEKPDDIDFIWSARMDRTVFTGGKEANYYSTVVLFYSPDSGWSVMKDTDFPGVRIDSISGHLRFWIEDFAIFWHNNKIWEPKRVTDLGGLKMQIANTAKDPSRHVPYVDVFLVKEVHIYVNSFEPQNLIVRADKVHKTGFVDNILFFPSGETPFSDIRYGLSFFIDPYRLRKSIRDSFDK